MSEPEQQGRSPAAPAPAGELTTFAALFSAVMLPMFMGAVDQTLLVTATPRIAAELGGLADTSWIAAGYLLAATITAPTYGRLGDRFGRRDVMLVALTVFMLGSLACALAPTMTLLIAARVLQGLGGGGLMVLSQALIGELVPPWERPRYQGYFALIFTTSSVGGPLIGGFVVHHYDWRWLGGFNRSSQHRQPGGVYGATRRMDDAVNWQRSATISRGSIASARG